MPKKEIKKLPGPKAKAIIEKDKKYVSPSYTRGYPLVAVDGKGAIITDPDGNRFLDFTSGIAVCSTGHCHPKIIKAITEQAKKLIHMSGTDFYYPVQAELAERLVKLFKGNKPRKVFFGNSGAEAIEAAFKLSRFHSKRQMVIAFYGAFHGRTMGALSLTASKSIQRKYYSPLVPGVIHIPYAYCYRCPYNLIYGECDIECVSWIEEVIFRRSIPAEEVAAIFVEPIQGEGGYIVPPPEFHTRLFRIAQSYGILYVADEVQTGIGRTGRMFAMEHFDIVPDIICLAKGIASGMPISAMIAYSDIMDWVPGSHASTFGGNPVACAAALATLDLVEKSLMNNARVVGDYLISELKKMQRRYEVIGDVRGKGLMIGVELVKDRETKTMAIKERDFFVKKAFERGLLLLGCGSNSIRLAPPLIITKADANRALAIIEEVLEEIGG
ncbi:MAG: acetyl ornithine aminotransferase family protein [Nitrospirae bacterium]|nr:acetyl ornithine aminotransferase family protein [Nitrospirota bacterium]